MSVPNAAPAAGGQGEPATPATPATPAAPAAAAPATPAAPAAADWTTGLTDDLKGYVQNKGFKDPTAVLDSYVNLEKLMGAPKERLLKLPEKADDKEAWGEVYNRLGRPLKPDEYKIEVPKEGGSPEFAGWAQGVFHELGLTKSQGEALAAKWNEQVGGSFTKVQEAETAKAAAETAALKKEWGAAFEQNGQVVDGVAETFGMKDDELVALKQTLGPARAMKFLHGIGSKLGEGNFINSEKKPGFAGAMSPEAAQNQIKALRLDGDFVRRYTAGDGAAKAEMTRLHQFAYPDSAE